jgi:hypothetical protein
LEAVTALAELGVTDHNVDIAVEFILSKQGRDGRWTLERTLGGKMWMRLEEEGKPSKWVTLRAVRAIKKIFVGEGREVSYDKTYSCNRR